jgi:hypothetical protein
MAAIASAHKLRGHSSPLDIEDLQFTTDGLADALKRSKTDQTGTGAKNRDSV